MFGIAPTAAPAASACSATSRAAAATFMDRFVGLFSTCCLALGACVLVAEVRRPGLVTMLVSVWSGLVVLLALGFHYFISLGLMLKYLGRVKPFQHYRAMSPVMLMAFSTA